MGSGGSSRRKSEPPPAVGLLLHAAGSRSAPWRATRPLVLTVPTPDLLDGLAQHPATRDCLGERLGPTTVVVPDHALASFREALGRLGLDLATP